VGDELQGDWGDYEYGGRVVRMVETRVGWVRRF